MQNNRQRNASTFSGGVQKQYQNDSLMFRAVFCWWLGGLGGGAFTYFLFVGNIVIAKYLELSGDGVLARRVWCVLFL